MNYKGKKVKSHLVEIVLILIIFGFISLTNAVSTGSVSKEVTAGIASVLGGNEVLSLSDIMAE